MSNTKSLGFVTMLDVSGSMFYALPQVKIDAKAFVRCGRVGDQFGVNAFSDNAWWVYPSGDIPNIVTISPSLDEAYRATVEIEKLGCLNMTNIGEAIQKATAMLQPASTGIKAYVLFSDGQSNVGPEDPAEFISSDIPIYIAGLGCTSTNYFGRFIAKNPKSKYYNQPNAYQVMQMFNHIIADSNQTNLALNDLATCGGSDYSVHNFNISGNDTCPQLNIVWSNEKYHYTDGYPSNTNINVTLIDPDNNTTDIHPTVAGDGFCVYNLDGIKPGQWKVLSQFSLMEQIYSTFGGVEYASGIRTELKFDNATDGVSNILLHTTVDGEKVQNLSVNATISYPEISVDKAMNQYSKEIAALDVDSDYEKLDILRKKMLDEKGVDILQVKHRVLSFAGQDGGIASANIDRSKINGAGNVQIKIEGINPRTGYKFTDVKSTIVM